MTSRKAAGRGRGVMAHAQSGVGREIGNESTPNKHLGFLVQWVQREVEVMRVEQLNRAFLATNHGTSYAENARGPSRSSAENPRKGWKKR